MADPIVAKIGELCGVLSGFVRSRAAGIAVAATAPYRHRLSAGCEVVDLFEFQVFLGEELDARYAEVVAWDDRVAAAQQRLDELRDLRDGLDAEVRAKLRRAADALRASYAEGAGRHLCRHASALPRSPGELQLVAKRFRAELTDPALEPPPARPGVEVDLVEVARSFGEPAEGLGVALAEMPEREAELASARARKKSALEELRGFSRRMTRFLEALADIAGDDRVASHARTILRGGP